MDTGTFPIEKWEEIKPLIGRGVLKDVSDELPPALPMNYRKLRYLLQDEEGKFYYCTAWEPPYGKPWLQIREYDETMFQKKDV